MPRLISETTFSSRTWSTRIFFSSASYAARSSSSDIWAAAPCGSPWGLPVLTASPPRGFQYPRIGVPGFGLDGCVDLVEGHAAFEHPALALGAVERRQR